MLTLANIRGNGVRSLLLLMRFMLLPSVLSKSFTIVVILWMAPAIAKPVDLICIVPQTSMYFTVTFDDETGRVLFEGLPTTKEVIERNRIVFTMPGRSDSYGYVIDRLTGAMIVVNQRTGTSQNSSCKIAKKAF